MALYTTTTRKEFEDKVLKSNKTILVDFWADWCPPCRAMAPHLHALADELDAEIDIVKVNIDNQPEYRENQILAGEYGVQSIPNMPIFKNGKEVERIIGFTPKSHLAEILKNHT